MTHGPDSNDPQAEPGASQSDLTERLAQLAELGAEPEGDLWPGIRQAIEGTPRQAGESPAHHASDTQRTDELSPHLDERFARSQREVSRWRWAAAVILLLGVAALSSPLLFEPNTDWQELAPRQRNLADLPIGSSVELQRILNRYLEEREELLRSISVALNDYPTELKRDIRNNLELMEGAMVEIERSVAEHSTDASSNAEMPELAALYERELRLLRDVDARLRGRAADRGL